MSYRVSNSVRVTYPFTTTGLIIAGLGYMFGPVRWTEVESLVVVRSVMPVRWWGLVFIIVGLTKVVLVVGWDSERIRLGSTIGGILAFMWATCIALAIPGGHLAEWSSIPAWYTIAGVQFAAAADIWSD